MSISLPLESVTPGVYGALLDLLRSSRSTSKRSALPASLRELVCVRASQLNGCSTCLDVHVPLAVRAGVEQRKLDALEHWREAAGLAGNGDSAGGKGTGTSEDGPDISGDNSDDEGDDASGSSAVSWSAEEVAALDVAERLTLTADPELGDKAQLARALERALEVFTKEQVAALEWTVVTINAFNRVTIVSEL